LASIGVEASQAAFQQTDFGFVSRRATVKARQEWPLVGGREPKNARLNSYFVEPMTGIEPAYSAWEADVLPLNYIGLFDWHR
jgi:hypothetical protein